MRIFTTVILRFHTQGLLLQDSCSVGGLLKWTHPHDVMNMIILVARGPSPRVGLYLAYCVHKVRQIILLTLDEQETATVWR